jgi:uncharacterized membrane-anchored protein YitT (DUF2179 family)
MNKALMIIAIILGVVFIVASVVYFLEPARFLPSFFPGYDRSLMSHHYKHGIGAFVLGIACFIFAWFQSGKKKSTASPSVHEEKQG